MEVFLAIFGSIFSSNQKLFIIQQDQSVLLKKHPSISRGKYTCPLIWKYFLMLIHSMIFNQPSFTTLGIAKTTLRRQIHWLGRNSLRTAWQDILKVWNSKSFYMSRPILRILLEVFALLTRKRVAGKKWVIHQSPH